MVPPLIFIIMKIKNIFSVLFLALGLISCNPNYYQVYKVNSSDLVQKDNSMVFENEDCTIMYNLWGLKGTMGFIFINKTDEDIFLDMTQTFFIKNGAANDYFRNRTYETRTFEALNLGYSVSNTYIGVDGYWPMQYYVPDAITLKAMLNVKKGVSSAVTVKESEFICVPAHSYKVFDYYLINPLYEKSCENKTDYPQISATLKTFTESNSPLKFKNRIAYSFKKDNTSLKHIENSFYLTEIKNYSKKGAIDKKKVTTNCEKTELKREYFKIGGPNQFYNIYKKKVVEFK